MLDKVQSLVLLLLLSQALGENWIGNTEAGTWTVSHRGCRSSRCQIILLYHSNSALWLCFSPALELALISLYVLLDIQEYVESLSQMFTSDLISMAGALGSNEEVLLGLGRSAIHWDYSVNDREMGEKLPEKEVLHIKSSKCPLQGKLFSVGLSKSIWSEISVHIYFGRQ